MCHICKKKFIEHSELQDKICRIITIKQFANNSPGFDVHFRHSLKIKHHNLISRNNKNNTIYTR